MTTAHSLPQPQQDLLTPTETAEYLGGMSVDTLAVWRATKRYPLPYLKVGRLVRYRKLDLDVFLASRIQNMGVQA